MYRVFTESTDSLFSHPISSPFHFHTHFFHVPVLSIYFHVLCSMYILKHDREMSQNSKLQMNVLCVFSVFRIRKIIFLSPTLHKYDTIWAERALNMMLSVFWSKFKLLVVLVGCHAIVIVGEPHVSLSVNELTW